MNLSDYVYVGQMAIETAIWVTLPMLGLNLIAGFTVSVFQAATQINDASLAFIPKIGAVILGMILFGQFMMSHISEFTIWVFGRIASVVP